MRVNRCGLTSGILPQIYYNYPHLLNTKGVAVLDKTRLLSSVEPSGCPVHHDHGFATFFNTLELVCPMVFNF